MKLFGLGLLWAALASAKCYEPNIAHLPPDYDPNDALLQSAFARVTAALTSAAGQQDFAATSFSVEITSSKQSLWSYHHTAPERNTSRPDIPKVNSDAVYRIASITKSFTVLALLYQHVAGNLSLDNSIDLYIDELKGEQVGSLPWKDITLRTLASQLSGIPSDCRLHGGEYCQTLEDLMKVVKSRLPVFAPKQASTYSNIAFDLLGVAIANVTDQSYESYITKAIFEPLNMSLSSFSQPPDHAGVIPLQPHFWDADIGINAPTGGIYSSTTDLSKYLRYVLTRYNGITSALNWLHPASPSFGLHSFYGTPWEIFRTDRILAQSKRAVTFVTKSGGMPNYSSIIITIPEYDLGITILLAGNPGLFDKIREIVTVEVVRAAEEVAGRQLQEQYAGTYTSEMPGVNSSLTLVADQRGLVFKEFIVDTNDILKSLPSLIRAPKDQPLFAQLTPTLLYRNESKEEGERWRVLIQDERTEDDGDVWDDFCMSNIDGISLGDLPMNEVVFWKNDKGIVQNVELIAFKEKLIRQEPSTSTAMMENEYAMEL